MSEIVEHLNCPICYEVPSGRVFQCRNGHAFCDECGNSLKICPQCRVVLEKERIRNRTFEELLNLVKFKCKNSELGCEKIMRRRELQTHLKFCSFGPFYFCKLIGFQDCPYNAVSSCFRNENQKPADLLLTHLQESHPELVKSNLEGDVRMHLTYKSLLSKTNNNNLEKGSVTAWTPHLITYYSEGKGLEEGAVAPIHLLILCQVSEATRNAAWICLNLDENQSPNIVEYKLANVSECPNGSTPFQSITWSAPILPFKDIEKNLEGYSVKLPFCFLNSFPVERGQDLEISVRFPIKSANHEEKNNYPNVILKELITFIERPALAERRKQRRPSCYDVEPLLNEDTEGDDEESIFNGIFCNECGQRPVSKVRYKCLQCIDYDLCRKCMERGEAHSHHVFARIQNKRQNDYFNWKHRLRMLKGKSSYI